MLPELFLMQIDTFPTLRLNVTKRVFPTILAERASPPERSWPVFNSPAKIISESLASSIRDIKEFESAAYITGRNNHTVKMKINVVWSSYSCSNDFLQTYALDSNSAIGYRGSHREFNITEPV